MTENSGPVKRSVLFRRRPVVLEINKGPAPKHQPFAIVGRSGEIRTHDPLLPKQVRYQAALHSVLKRVRYTAGVE